MSRVEPKIEPDLRRKLTAQTALLHQPQTIARTESARVVERTRRSFVVEKLGQAAEVAIDRDSRG